jgi:nucleoside-diphosphate-sugar epimerase
MREGINESHRFPLRYVIPLFSLWIENLNQQIRRSTMTKVAVHWISLLVIFVLSITTPTGCHAFEFPKFPWETSKPNAPSSKAVGAKALRPGDTIAVVGASGNVGKLVALRLSDTYKVNGIVRDAASVMPFFEGREDRIKLYEVNLLDEISNSQNPSECPASLLPALRNANAIVICTGTTAFPTKAWTKSGESKVADDVIQALLKNSFNVKDAISSLDAQGLNTPNNVDAKANEMLVRAWNKAAKVVQKRIIMLSSIGVQRRETMPFPILNACGVLDGKAAGEEAISNAAKQGGYSYTIIRPGQLFGGPYDNNYYLGTLFQLDKDAATQDVSVGKGDTLIGDTLRSTLAEVTAQICESDCARDLDFAVVNIKGDVPTIEVVQERLKAL